MDITAVKRSYARWAPVYDFTFGAVTSVGRKRAARYINTRGGSVLEVGVGTGLSLGYYDQNVTVTGIDFSEDMLEKAREKVQSRALKQVRALRQMDARSLDFADHSFDTVTAMHVMSVVPEPERVIAEMARVTRPGGEIVMINHFARDRGFLAFVERTLARFPHLIGWHSDFERSRVLSAPDTSLIEERSFPPVGVMNFMVLRKAA